MNTLSVSPPFPYGDLPPDISSFARISAAQIRPQLAQTAETLVAVGAVLCQVKEVLPHGHFQHWLEAEFGMSVRTAERFMQTSRRLGSIVDRLAGLSSDSLYALAAPSTPDSVIEGVVEGKIEPTPRAIRAEIARWTGQGGHSHPTRGSWEALKNLVDRYSHVEPKTLAAELLVELAYSCELPDAGRIEREIRAYTDDCRDDVRAGLEELADVLTSWAEACS